MKISVNIIVTAVALSLATFYGCGGKGHIDYTYPTGGNDATGNIEVNADGYPQSIKVVNFTDDLGFSDKCMGWYALIDVNAADKPVFNVHHQSPAKTPADIFKDYKAAGKTPYIVTNAGYFWDGKSLSVCIHDSVLESIAAQTANATGGVTAYPVRSAFGMKKSGGFEATWVYCPTDGDNKPYSYPSPLDNDEKAQKYMSAPPSSKTPGAKIWSPKEGIGGGPMLVKDGKNVAFEYYWKEVLEAGGTLGTSRQPRTAIGATKDGRIILLVCDGRGMNGSKGYTLKELADKLISLGADIAINLDGGGSSTFVGADGKVKNRPSDSRDSDSIVQRKVPTAIVISAK